MLLSSVVYLVVFTAGVPEFFVTFPVELSEGTTVVTLFGTIFVVLVAPTVELFFGESLEEFCGVTFEVVIAEPVESLFGDLAVPITNVLDVLAALSLSFFSTAVPFVSELGTCLLRLVLLFFGVIVSLTVGACVLLVCIVAEPLPGSSGVVPFNVVVMTATVSFVTFELGFNVVFGIVVTLDDVSK